STLASTGSPPSARCFHTAIYDPVRDRMLVFGGYDASATHYHNDLWALSLAGTPAWSALAPAGTPPSARIWHTAIYDPVRDRMLVFGGYDGRSLLNDGWALSLAGSPAWTALAPAGSPPSARSSPTASYDPVRDGLVVLRGNDDISLLNDVFALPLAGTPAWSALAPARTPPSARLYHTAIYDPVRDRMLVFGGYGTGYLSDLWTLVWGTTGSVPGPLPHTFEFVRLRPNPSQGETLVDFDLGVPARVVLDVFDAQARRVNPMTE